MTLRRTKLSREEEAAYMIFEFVKVKTMRTYGNESLLMREFGNYDLGCVKDKVIKDSYIECAKRIMGLMKEV